MTMETKAAAEDVKMDLFEDDDEFEEFEINEESKDWTEEMEVAEQWEDDWEDDNVHEDFSQQLRKALEDNTTRGCFSLLLSAVQSTAASSLNIDNDKFTINGPFSLP